ncbi:hypothetical protein CR513_49221, partial [Mucuna pruriens]
MSVVANGARWMEAGKNLSKNIIFMSINDVKMEASLEALDLWEAVEEDYDVLPLLDNPTMAQIMS